MPGYDGLHNHPPRAMDDSALLSSSPPPSSPPPPPPPPLPGLGLRSLHVVEDHFALGNHRLLKKSRSISASNGRNDSAMPRFPGPLLPTVRRLNSSPASSKPVTRDIGDGDAEPLAADTKTEHIHSSIETSFSHSSDQSYHNTGEADASFQKTSLSSASSRHGNREDIEPRTPDNATAVIVGGESTTLWANSSNLYPEPSILSAPAGAWKYRARMETDGNDSLLMPPAKSQRTAADYDSRSDCSKSDQFKGKSLQGLTAGQEFQAHTSQREDFVNGHFSNQYVKGYFQPFRRPQDAAVAKPPQHPSPASKQSVEKANWKFLDTGPPISSRRRRIPESSSSRQASDAWLSEIRRPMKTGTSTTEGSGSNLHLSKPRPSKLASFVRWPFEQNKSVFDYVILLLLVIISTSSMLYSVAEHQQLVLLKRENARLKEYSVATCQSFENVESYSKSTIKTTDFEEVSPSRITWKFSSFGVLVLLLCGSSVTRYCLAIPHSTRKLSDKSTEEEVPISKRVAYLVDVLFSTHPYAKAMALLLATLLLIGFGGISLYSVGDESLSGALWRSWTYVADSGNHADSVGLGPRIVSVSISIGGMLIFALMLGLVSDAISEKVDSLRKGKSEVIESNHTLILGWSDKLGSLLKQLAIANQSLGGGVVVVLAERDKEEMESDIAKLEFDFMGTAVICRSGSPLIMADLKKVSVSKARSIIVLAEVENADQSDARALRVVLSLTAVKEGLRGHIVVELSDLDNEPLVKLVGGDVIETVVAHDVIGRLMIQCARQPGLAQIWEDILGFDNAEFYLKRWPQLDGMRFEDVLVSFPEAIPCGVKVAAEKGKMVLNPDDDYILLEGDEVLVIAEDDDTYAPAPLPQIRCGSLPKVIVPPKLPERILFCGWRRDIHDMIKVLDAFLPSGSELWIFSDVRVEEREKKLFEGNLDLLLNIKLEHREGNPVIRRHLESLPLQTFDSILILADEKLEENVVIADSRSLATLLLIRDIQSKRLPLSSSRVTQVRRPGFTHSSWIGEMQQASDKSIIISEVLDSRTKHLVSVSQIGDYVLSNELVSMALAMVSEEKQINRVLEELFAEEGNELFIRSAEFYLYDQEELSFFQVMIRARQRRETVIGYRKSFQERAIINPPNKAARQKWSIADVFIVLAWNE